MWNIAHIENRHKMLLFQIVRTHGGHISPAPGSFHLEFRPPASLGVFVGRVYFTSRLCYPTTASRFMGFEAEKRMLRILVIPSFPSITGLILGGKSYKIGTLGYKGGTTMHTKPWAVKAAAAALALALTAPVAAMPTAHAEGTAVVALEQSGSTLNLRASASTSATIIGRLHHGDRVTVLSESNGWSRVEADGLTGYVSSRYLQQSSDSVITDTQKGTVQASSLNVRSGPGTQYIRIDSLSRGASVTIIGASGGFYKIKYGSGTGFVSKDYIRLTEASPDPTDTPLNQSGVVNVSSSLNVRSGPGTGYRAIGRLGNGAQVTIIGESGDFYKIQYGSGTGYVSKAYIRLGSTVTTSPSASAAPTASPGQAVLGRVLATSLNVRSGPGTGYAKVGSVTQNAVVTVLGLSLIHI